MFLQKSEKFSLPELEEKVLKFWKENQVFEKSLKKTEKGKPFTFYDGPPFATGLPHYGHILASTIKDVIPRYQTMKGRFVRRRWGWDCHGLPIEEIVERSLGISGKKQIEEIGIQKFNETCRSKVLEFADEWGKMVRRIARWIDFDNSYKTMDRDYMESVWWAFKQIYNKGLVYEGRKVLMYCPRCETPISNFEVAMDNSYKDVTEETVMVKFKIKSERDVYLLAWTTTPWTLPGNVALAINPDVAYVKCRVSKENFVLAKERLVVLSEPHEIIREFKGKDLIGLNYEPLFNIPAVKSDKAFKVYPADFVSTEEGTGIVHTAVVYGEEDYELGQKVGLPVVPLLDSKGIFNDEAPKFLHGKYFKDADALIITDLEKRGLIFRKERQTHSYPHCWRCSTPLFYNAIPAWFINVQKIKKALISSNKKEINWYPAHLKLGRYKNSVEQAPDWNISRNRYWGNPFPVWKCKNCGKAQIVGSIEELEKNQEKSANKYILVRHADAENNLEGLHSCWPEKKKYPLTTIGKEQAHKLAEGLSKRKVSLIFSSDLLRTKETAEIIAREIGLEVNFDPRLRELNVGDFNSRLVEEYHRYFHYPLERFTRPAPNGESLNEVRTRVFDFIRSIEKDYKNKTIAIVSHGDPLWMLHAVMTGLANEEQMSVNGSPTGFYPEKGGVYEVKFRKLPRSKTGLVDLHRPYIDEVVLVCPKCGGKAARVNEIFDSWMEAASMPFAEYHYPFENKKVFESRFPAQFVAEYIPQTRAWFYVMHVVSLIIFGHAPFENVVTTGTVLAEDGSKMSKSKGNSPDPWEVINKYGVDALRFYLMNSPVMQADDLNFSVKEVEKIFRKNVLILWNVYSYFELYARQINWRTASPKKSSPMILDRWICARTNQMINLVTDYLDNYDTVRATRTIEEYINDLSTWYLRRSRDRKDNFFFATLYDSLLKTCQMIAPVMPYLSEILYLNLVRSFGKGGDVNFESVHLTHWPKAEKLTKEDKSVLAGMEEIRRLASLALAKRAGIGIKVRQPLAALKIKVKPFDRSFDSESLRLDELRAKDLLKILRDEVNVKEIIFDKNLKEEIELNAEITHELKEEGWLREFVRLVQGLRKDASLEPKDKIILLADLSDELRHVVNKNENFVKNRVGAKSIEYKRSAKFDIELETKLDEWPIWLGLRK